MIFEHSEFSYIHSTHHQLITYITSSTYHIYHITLLSLSLSRCTHILYCLRNIFLYIRVLSTTLCWRIL